MNTPTIIILSLVGVIVYLLIGILYMRLRYKRIEQRRPWSITSYILKKSSNPDGWYFRILEAEEFTSLAGFLWVFFVGIDLLSGILLLASICILAPFKWLDGQMKLLAKRKPYRNSDTPEEH